MQDLQDALMLSMREVKDLRLAKESIEIEADQISYDLGKMRTEVKDLRFEIANLRDRLKTDARSIAYYIEKEAKLDGMLNKTIDAHEVTKQRLLDYENEAGVPKSASEREAYMSYNPK